MILEYQKIELLEKTVFERIVFNPPLKASEVMENEACLIFARNGQSRLHGGIQTEELKTDDAVLMKCGNFVNSWLSNEQQPNEALAIHFYPDVIELIFENQVPHYLLKGGNPDAPLIQKIEQSKILKSYVDGLLLYFENPQLFTRETAIIKLRELIGLLYNLDSHGIRELLADLFTPKKLEFKQVIAKHLFDDLSIDNYAELLNLSTSTFKRKFKEVYDTSPGKYILGKKLEKATLLLRTTDDRIGDIGFVSGFEDVSNFTKVFTKKFGLSPSQYRKQEKQI